MMTLTQFETFSIDAQAAYTWQHGNYLTSRLTTQSLVNLFNLGDFYVEITSDAHLRYVHRVSLFKTSASLDPVYVDAISLHDLLTDPLPGIQLVKEDALSRNSR